MLDKSIIGISRNIRSKSMEGCFLGDLIALGIKMSDAGLGDYWDDVDAVVRNHIAETQFVKKAVLERVVANAPKRPLSSDWNIQADGKRHNVKIYPGMEDYENIIERALGIFASDILPNSVKWVRTMQCCTANATQGLYYAWEGIVINDGKNAQVNLFLNRATPWLDIDSYLPYEGKVIIKNKTKEQISVRIPSCVNDQKVECKIDDVSRRTYMVGRYIVIGDLKGKENIELSFPVIEKTVSCTANAGIPEDEEVYTISLRGSTVVEVFPRDESPHSYPFYERDYMKKDKAPMKTVTRYISSVIPKW